MNRLQSQSLGWPTLLVPWQSTDWQGQRVLAEILKYHLPPQIISAFTCFKHLQFKTDKLETNWSHAVEYISIESKSFIKSIGNDHRQLLSDSSRIEQRDLEGCPCGTGRWAHECSLRLCGREPSKGRGGADLEERVINDCPASDLFSLSWLETGRRHTWLCSVSSFPLKWSGTNAVCLSSGI